MVTMRLTMAMGRGSITDFATVWNTEICKYLYKLCNLSFTSKVNEKGGVKSAFSISRGVPRVLFSGELFFGTFYTTKVS